MRRFSLAVLCGCGPKVVSTPVATATTAEVTAVQLPGAGAEGVRMDFLGFDAEHDRLWVPAGGTGNVYIVHRGDVTPIGGFPTSTVERDGKTRVVGPSSIAFASGFAFVGNRGDSSICALDATSLARAGCVSVSGMPDALQVVVSTHELWVTTPHQDDTIVVLDIRDPTKPAVKSSFTVPGAPECTAVDEARGVFYTNLEDKDRTAALDLHDHHVLQTWPSGCGEDGPKGLAVEPEHGFVMVACPDHVDTLDPHSGAVLGRVDTGAGVDAITYVPATRRLFVGAATAGKLTVAALDGAGQLTVARQVDTPGARNAVVSPDGTAYLTDSAHGQILVVAD